MYFLSDDQTEQCMEALFLQDRGEKNKMHEKMLQLFMGADGSMMQNKRRRAHDKMDYIPAELLVMEIGINQGRLKKTVHLAQQLFTLEMLQRDDRSSLVSYRAWW